MCHKHGYTKNGQGTHCTHTLEKTIGGSTSVISLIPHLCSSSQYFSNVDGFSDFPGYGLQSMAEMFPQSILYCVFHTCTSTADLSVSPSF